ncbi:MAG: glycosyl transferase family protein [Alphaproteobacteria bacterium]|nr:glycosyl transferase family protein [Alphaproteobacteria bacterium]
MTEPHPFAQYVRILGRGRTASRSLTIEEAEASMAMIMRNEALPEQIGAFMMLLRVKEETAEEIAGFVKAVRGNIDQPVAAGQADLDWSSYAGKRRQLPWFLLAVMALTQSGVRVFMHGTEGHTPGRLYTRATLEQLGFPIADNLADADAHIRERRFAYLPLQNFSPRLYDLIQLRNVMGLRSPVHTVSRMLNPMKAPCSLHGIFHPGFMTTHQEASRILGDAHMAVFRGEGGEIECRPNKSFDVRTVHDGALDTEEWPSMLVDSFQAVDTEMDSSRLQGVWRGEIDDDYARAAITGTLAVALKALGKASTIKDALTAGAALWDKRDKFKMGA